MTISKSTIDQYLDYLRAIGKKEKHVNDVFYSLRLFTDYIGVLGLNNIKYLNKSHMDAWQLYQSQRVTSRGLPLKPISINADFLKLKNFLKYLYDRGAISCPAFEYIEYLKEPALLPTSLLTDDEITVLLSVFDSTTKIGFRNKTIVMLLYTSGLRISELCNMNLQDINYDQSTACIMGKGDKQRIVPIGEGTLNMIESYVKAIRPFFVKRQASEVSDNNNTSLFLSRVGKRVTPDSIQQVFKKACTKAGFKRITPHSMRRSFATEMVKANANLYHVKEIMGHADLSQLQRYVRLNVADLKRTHKQFHPRG